MSRDSGVIEKRKFSVVTTDIGSTNSHPKGTNLSFSTTGSGREIKIDGGKFLGLG
jgi:hypothetical protein